MSEFLKTEAGKLYFATFSVVDWIDVFTRRVYAEIFFSDLRYCVENKGLELYAYCLMSNHFHLIASVADKPLSHVLRDLKKFSAVHILQHMEEDVLESRREWMLRHFAFYGKINKHNTHYQFWQQGNHPVELESRNFIEQKREYIYQNPVKAGIVAHPEDYVYNSCSPHAPVPVLSLCDNSLTVIIHTSQ